MPAGERVATVQPGVLQTPEVRGGENAMEKLQRAFEAGILNYNEIADGLTIRPAERAAKQGDLRAKMKKQAFDESVRPLREDIERNALEGAKAQSGFDAAVTKARTGFHTPADIAELGRLGAAGDVLDAEGNVVSKEAMIRKAHNFIDDPEGLKQYYRESTLKLGGTVDPGMSLDQLKLAFTTALDKGEQREVNKMRLEAMLDRYVKSGESAAKLEADLRDKYFGNDVVKRFVPVAEGFGKVRQYARKQQEVGIDAMTPQDDMSLIFGYMKILDPGSTVREGEYATAEQTRGLYQNIWALYNKAKTGQKLTPEQRLNFASAAEQAFQPHRQMYDALRRDYANIAAKGGARPEMVLGTSQIDTLGLNEPLMGGQPDKTGAVKPAKPKTNPALPPGQAWIRNKRTGKIVKARRLPSGDWDPIE